MALASPSVASDCSGVRINPPDYDWAAGNIVPLDMVADLKKMFNEWAGLSVGGECGDIPLDAMDAERRFAYDICQLKAEERERCEVEGTLSQYRALRMVMTGTAGTDKSRTVRAIAAARRGLARAVAVQQSEAISDEDVRNAALLVAPTGCASFRLKFGATTIHSAFGLSISNWCEPSVNRSDFAFLRRVRRLRAASLVVMDDFSMIGRQMMGKVCFKAMDLLGAERVCVGQVSSLGGKDVILAGDLDGATPCGDEAGHKMGPCKKYGGNVPRDMKGRYKIPPPGSMDLPELVSLGVAFRAEFNDCVLLQERHWLVDPAKEGVPGGDRAVFVEHVQKFREVMRAWSDLSWSKDQHAWLAQQCNRSAIKQRDGGAEIVCRFDDALRLVDTGRSSIGRSGGKDKQLGGADKLNLIELFNLARRTAVPVARFSSYHKVSMGQEAIRGDRFDDDAFGLANELFLCVGARVLLTRNLWIQAGLVNGAQGVVKGFVWPFGGDPNSSDSMKRAPICVIVEFADVNFDDEVREFDGHLRRVERRFFPGISGLGKRCVPIFRYEADCRADSNVKRQQFPLTLAWALPYWKVQGMTLRRVRVCLTPSSVKRIGVGFMAVSCVVHPHHLMFDHDLPSYEEFQVLKNCGEFRGRQRYKLKLHADWARTIRRYRCYAKEPWPAAAADLADRLLGHVTTIAKTERASNGLHFDLDAWPWLDVAHPPVDDVLADAVARECALGKSHHVELLRVAALLKGERQLPGLLDAMGCLIPRFLHPSLDGVRSNGVVRVGAITSGVALPVVASGLDMSEERNVVSDGRVSVMTGAVGCVVKRARIDSRGTL